ncbi:hypothetical protein IE984_25880 [Klebsiella pneumoniae]|nr:hypothetical protein [Klebsiella pneumoniae]
MTKIGALKPDVVYWRLPSGSGPAGAPDARAGCRPNSSPATVSSPRNWSRPPAGAVHQRRADDLWSGSAHPPGRQSGDRKFRASGFEPEGYTLYAYASIQAIAAAWNAVGIDNAKASDWLKSHDVETVMGKKAWDGKGDLKVSDYVVYQWDDKGKYHQL